MLAKAFTLPEGLTSASADKVPHSTIMSVNAIRTDKRLIIEH
jgi:hypothetical protein